MITPLRGQYHVEYYPKTASTAFAVGEVVTILPTAGGAGTLIPATSSSGKLIGTILKTVAATDSDYASATMVPVLVGDTDSEYLCLTASAAQTDCGEFVDLTDSKTVNVASYTYGVMEVTQYISATSIVCKMCKKNGPAVTTS